jgi:hypothetical protein
LIVHAAEQGQCCNAANSPPCLISIPLPQDLNERLHQYLDIEPKAPIVNVPEVKLYALCDMFDRWRRTS